MYALSQAKTWQTREARHGICPTNVIRRQYSDPVFPLLRPLPIRPETRTTPQFNYLSGQEVTYHNPAPSPSGHRF